MSDGEAFLLVVLAPVAAIYWGAWFRAAFRTCALGRSHRRLAILSAGLLLGIAIVLITLLTAADPVVRNNIAYIILFLEVAAVALAAATAAVSVIGLSPLDDAIRRPNPAAVWATTGLWIGISLAIAGANVGRGETIGTTNGPLALGVTSIVALWAMFAAVAGLSSITQDRDPSSGIRLAGLTIAWGLIIGRAIADDWESVAGTLRDYATQAWPTVVLLAFAIPVERLLRPSLKRPFPKPITGFGPAAFYLLVAIGWVIWLGKP